MGGSWSLFGALRLGSLLASAALSAECVCGCWSPKLWVALRTGEPLVMVQSGELAPVIPTLTTRLCLILWVRNRGEEGQGQGQS